MTLFDAHTLSHLIQSVVDDVLSVTPRNNLMIREKEKDDFVTAVDLGIDHALTKLLKQSVDAPIISEETTPNPFSLSNRLREPWLWVIDPLDGTSNFINGSDRYCVMVALLNHDTPVFSCIYAPAKKILAVAENGSGVMINNQKTTIRPVSKDIDKLRGIIPGGITPPHIERSIAENRSKLLSWNNSTSCGIDYLDVAMGNLDFALYTRSFIWDHLPGVLMIREAKGVAESWIPRSPYDPFNPMLGILATSHIMFPRIIDHFDLGKSPDKTRRYMNTYRTKHL